MSGNNLKPAFPRWLRRIDPLLAREDENLLFQFFRERRGRVGGLLEWLTNLPLIVVYCLVSLGMGALLLDRPAIAFSPIFLGALFLILLPASGLLFYRSIYPQSSHDGPASFPKRMVRCVAGRINLRLVEDIAATGLKGSVVLEAIYLEAAEYWKHFFLALAPVLTFAVIVTASTVPISGSDFVALIVAAILLACINLLFLEAAYRATPLAVASGVRGEWLMRTDYPAFRKEMTKGLFLFLLLLFPSLFLLRWASLGPLFHFLRIAWRVPAEEVGAAAVMLAWQFGVVLPVLFAGCLWMRRMSAVAHDADDLFDRMGQVSAADAREKT